MPGLLLGRGFVAHSNPPLRSARCQWPVGALVADTKQRLLMDSNGISGLGFHPIKQMPLETRSPANTDGMHVPATIRNLQEPRDLLYNYVNVFDIRLIYSHNEY